MSFSSHKPLNQKTSTCCIFCAKVHVSLALSKFHLILSSLCCCPPGSHEKFCTFLDPEGVYFGLFFCIGHEFQKHIHQGVTELVWDMVRAKIKNTSQAEVISISYSAHRSGVPGVRIENSKPFAALSYHKRGKPVRPNWLATDPVLLLCSI